MLTWKDDLVERDRRQDMLAQAERARSRKLAGLSTSPVMDWFRARLVRLGAWLEQLGCRLQHRYSPQSRIEVNVLTPMGKASGGC